MARSCGIRLGPRRYEIVVLDGSPKKHRITAFKTGEFDPASTDPIADFGGELKAAIKELRLPRENVGLVIDSGHAAFRLLTLPFAERSKIDQVLKFEVESKLPQWSIEDVVVDYHVLAESETSSDLLVSAVPKDDVQSALDICERAGIEPLEAELETSAMVNAACAASICNIDDAQLLVHVGDYSTSVVVMDAGEVREMRVIHIGALTHEAPRSETPDPGEPTQETQETQSEESGASDLLPAIDPVDPIEASRRADQAIKRIRRELGRTLSGARTVNPIEAVYVCGMELPGLVGSSVLDVPVYVLDCFEEDSGQPADGVGALVIAYGAAIRELGGGLLSPSLRREELRFTGTWERVEFPLAVAFLLLTTLLGVIFILQRRELEYQDINGTRFWLRSSNNFMLGNPKRGTEGKLYPPPKEIKDYAAKFAENVPIDPSIEPEDALNEIRRMLVDAIGALRADLGQDASVTQPQSALVGTTMVLKVLEAQHEKWRPSIRRIQAQTVAGRGNIGESVKVSLDLVFFAENTTEASEHYEAFRTAISNQPWLVRMPLKGTTALDNEKGVSVTGLTISVDVSQFYAQQHEAALLGN